MTEGPNLFGNLLLTRNGDQLILHSKNNARWFGVLYGGIAVMWTNSWISAGNWTDPNYWFGSVAGVAFILIGGFFALPRTITTIFDLRSRQVAFNTTIWRYQRTHIYSFADVAGLGFSQDDDTSCMPMLKIKNGPSRWLATVNVKFDPSNMETLRTVCTETGLRALPTGRWSLV